MSKYLLEASYSAEGLRGAVKEGFVSRQQAVSKALGSLGGTLDALYFGIGGEVYVVCDFPDAISVASLAFATASTGLVKVKSISPLLTPEEADQAAKKNSTYRAPGAKKK